MTETTTENPSPKSSKSKLREQRDNSSLQFYQLVGAPMLSLVQAEAQAMKASLEYIEQMGFRDQDGDNTNDNLGELRTLTFRYKKQAVGDGEPTVYKVHIPVLSLIPIPMMQIKQADFEFYLKITDTSAPHKTQTRINAKSGASLSEPVKNEQGETLVATQQRNFLAPELMELKATMGTEPQADKSTRSSEFQMKVKLNIQQTDFPTGVLKLLNIMDGGVVQEEVSPSENNADQKPDEATENNG